VFSRRDPAQLERGFLRWVQVIAAAANTTGGVAAIDGKSVRAARKRQGSALHIVSAWASAPRLVLGQEILRRPGGGGRGGPWHRLGGVKLPDVKHGFVLLPRRWVVERTFAWAARFRRLARDYERLPETFAGLHFIDFAA
jgi:hypothetical protein